MSRTRIEVCVEGLEGALAAQRGGADRLELCCALDLGGLTPSAGLTEEVRTFCDLELVILVRPRPGDFLYDAHECHVVERDIVQAREMGADGVAVGLLDADGHIPAGQLAAWIQAARPLKVTFHRAFDLAADPSQGLDVLIEVGVDRLLTSGQAPRAEQGTELLTQLVQRAKGRLDVMAGGGVRPENVAELVRTSGVRDVHLSARISAESAMRQRREGLRLGGGQVPGEYEQFHTDESLVRGLRVALGQD